MSGSGVYGIFFIIVFLIIFIRFIKICIIYSNNRRIAQNNRVTAPPSVAVITANESQMDIDSLPPYRQPIKDYDLPPTYDDVMAWNEQQNTRTDPTVPTLATVTVLNEEANKY